MTSPRRVSLLLAAIAVAGVLSCGDGGSPAGPDDNGGSGDDGTDPDPYSHTLSPGASARDFLTSDSFPVLVVEVDYMPGYAPDPQALSGLRTFLEARVHKSSVVIPSPTGIPAGGQDTYTLNEIAGLESDHRDRLTHGDTLTAYMLFLDGKFEQDGVLGVAYYNTSTAYFGGALDDVSGGLTQPSRELTETTVFRHEFGHLFGLVAIPGSGTDMQTEHQDEPNGHHCDNDQCLMYYAVESTDLFGSVFGGQVPGLDANCLADLEANGGR